MRGEIGIRRGTSRHKKHGRGEIPYCLSIKWRGGLNSERAPLLFAALNHELTEIEWKEDRLIRMDVHLGERKDGGDIETRTRSI